MKDNVMDVHENQTFITRHALLLWTILVSSGLFILIFLIAYAIGISKPSSKDHKTFRINPERRECIQWLVEHDVIVLTPLYKGPNSHSEADYIHWIDENLNVLPMISLRDKKIRDEDLRYLYYLPGVRVLFLDTDTTSITSTGFQQLYYCPNLERVSITGSSTVPNDWITILASHGTISDWEFYAPIIDQSLDILCKSQSPVKRLDIDNQDTLTINGYQSIGMLRDLETLVIDGKKPLGAEEIGQILKCSRLEAIYFLGDFQISDEIVRKLLFLPSLKKLCLSLDTELSNETLAILANRPLKGFDILSPRVTHYQQKYSISASKALEKLVLEACPRPTDTNNRASREENNAQ